MSRLCPGSISSFQRRVVVAHAAEGKNRTMTTGRFLVIRVVQLFHHADSQITVFPEIRCSLGTARARASAAACSRSSTAPTTAFSVRKLGFFN